MGSAEEEEKKLAVAILEYLTRHSDAQDTMDGIASWWVAGQQRRQPKRMLGQGLAILLNQHLILESVDPKGERIYQVNSQKREEIARFLSKR